MTTAKLHAVLSPSAAWRWINCPGSVKAGLEQQSGDTGSVYAHAGTAAHELLELCLRLHCAPDELKGAVLHRYTDAAGKEVGHEVDEDMIEAVGHCYDYIAAWQAQHPHGKVFTERTVHWGAHRIVRLPPEQASGTLDVALADAGELEVLDYKHGAGVAVSALDNEQLKLYAVGALCDPAIHAVIGVIDEVSLRIVQPRARHSDGPVRGSVVTVAELEKWLKDDVVVSAKQALKPKAPRVAGKWCRWCAAAPTCRALIDHVMEQAGTEFGELGVAAPPRDADTLNDEELARAMAASQLIEAWAHAVRGRVLAMLLGGQPLPGWKLVLGRRTRSWRDDDVSDIIKQAHEEFGDPAVYAPRKLLTVAKMEEQFKDSRPKGRTAAQQREIFKSLFGGYVKHSTPAPHVAPVDDVRPEYNPGAEFDPLA